MITNFDRFEKSDISVAYHCASKTNTSDMKSFGIEFLDDGTFYCGQMDDEGFVPLMYCGEFKSWTFESLGYTFHHLLNTTTIDLSR